MIREYNFVLNVDQFRTELVPAMHEFSIRRSASRLRSLIWKASRRPSSIDAVATSGSRLLILGIEFHLYTLLNRQRALAIAERQVAQDLIVALCLEYVTTERKLHDITTPGLIQWLCEELPGFGESFRYCTREKLSLPFGEGAELYQTSDVETNLRILRSVVIPEQHETERKTSVSILEQALSSPNYALGLVAF